MFALPLVGWGMLSAARYPIVDYGPLELPPILPHYAALYAALRTAHMVLAFLLFAAFLAHFAAALMHALIYRDGIFPSRVSWKARAGNLAAATENEVRPARTVGRVTPPSKSPSAPPTAGLIQNPKVTPVSTSTGRPPP